MLSGIIGGLVSMFLFRYVIPVICRLPDNYDADGLPADQIESHLAEHARNKTTFGALIALGGVVASVAVVALLAFICNLRAKDVTAITLVPGWAPFTVVGMFVAMLTSLVVFAYAMQRLLANAGPANEDLFPLYIRLNNLKSRYDTQKLFRALTIILAVPTALLLLFAIDNYSRFADDRVVLNPFFSFGESQHRYEEVASIITAPRLIAPNGKVVDRRVYVIRFQNGDKWTSDNAPGNYEDGTILDVVQRVHEKSFRPIQERDVLSRDML